MSKAVNRVDVELLEFARSQFQMKYGKGLRAGGLHVHVRWYHIDAEGV